MFSRSLDCALYASTLVLFCEYVDKVVLGVRGRESCISDAPLPTSGWEANALIASTSFLTSDLSFGAGNLCHSIDKSSITLSFQFYNVLLQEIQSVTAYNVTYQVNVPCLQLNLETMIRSNCSQ